MAFIAESWVYMEHDMEMFFVDQLGIGNFDYPLGTHETNIDEASIQSRFHPKRMAEELIKKTSESYAFDYGGDRLDFLYDMVTYKGEGPETYVEIGYVVPSHQLGTVSDGQGLKTWLNTHVVFRDDDYNRMANVSKRIGPIERSMEVVAGKKPGVDLHTAMLDMNAPAGSYLSAVEVRDEATRRIGIFEQVFTVPDYDSDLTHGRSAQFSWNNAVFGKHQITRCLHITHWIGNLIIVVFKIFSKFLNGLPS